jgi:hypothetical protein
MFLGLGYEYIFFSMKKIDPNGSDGAYLAATTRLTNNPRTMEPREKKAQNFLRVTRFKYYNRLQPSRGQLTGTLPICPEIGRGGNFARASSAAI